MKTKGLYTKKEIVYYVEAGDEKKMENYYKNAYKLRDELWTKYQSVQIYPNGAGECRLVVEL